MPVTGMHERGGDPASQLASLQRLIDLLDAVSARMGPAHDVQLVLRVAIDALRSELTFRGGSVCLVDAEGVYIAAADPAITDDVAAARVPIGTGLVGRCVAEGAVVWSPDLDTDERVDQHLRRMGSNADIHSYLAVPLVCLGEVIGALQVDSPEIDAFDRHDLQVLRGLATLVAGAIESARRHEQVQDLERLRTEFVTRVSHELNTPLSILMGMAQTLEAVGPQLDAATMASMCTAIVGASERLEQLVTELLTISSIEAGLGVKEPAVMAVEPLLLEVADDCADPDRVTVTPSSAVAWVDATVARHCLRRLVDNGLRFGTTVRLSVDDVLDGAGDEPGPFVAVHVDDDGPGIDPRDRARIFERFAGRHDHIEPGGLGLGLPVARQLARSLGGDIVVRRAPTGGARFTVRLRTTAPG